MAESIRKRAVREAVKQNEVRDLLKDLAGELLDTDDEQTLNLVVWTLKKMRENAECDCEDAEGDK